MPENTAEKIVSPCIDICIMDDKSGLCRGCFRTIEEIVNWSSYSHEERLSLMNELDGRKIND